MCLGIRNHVKPAGLIATKDIICYKVLDVHGEGTPDACAVSPYMDFNYEFGKVFYASIKLGGEPGSWSIDEGLHSFVSFEAAEEESFGDQYIFVAVIPKGTRYWHGDFNGTGDSYASEALMVLDRKSARSKRFIRNLPSRLEN